MNPVSKTAYLTCGARAEDAAKPKPVCGDRYAERFLAGAGEAVYRQFKKEAGPAASIVARHRLIDDLLRERIAGNPDTAVVIVGAGFDSRAFRIDGGRWIEIDEAPVIEHKNMVLPAGDCRNPLRRIAIDFAQEALIDKLPPFAATTPVVVVMEGIFFYLDENQRCATLAALRRAYPRHSLICDLSTRLFMERYGKSLARRIEALGAKLVPLPEDPAAHFLATGYRLEARYSIVEKMLAYAGTWISALTSWFLPRAIREGLALHVFRLVPGMDETNIAGEQR
ncbi:MAG TPA: class I SAM-dependent methyltransferase [Burkholderiaceae bacterium]